MPENPIKPSRVLTQVSWTKPHEGWAKLNSDGSMLGNSKKAGGGAVIRCSNGDWIAGCLRKLGNPSCILAELWALEMGFFWQNRLVYIIFVWIWILNILFIRKHVDFRS